MKRIVKHMVHGRSRAELSQCIDEWIVGRNAMRNRAILKSKMIDGISYMALAEEYDLSLKRVKTIVKEGVKTLEQHL